MNITDKTIITDGVSQNVVAATAKKTSLKNHKKWSVVTLMAAAALTLGACSNQEEEKPMESSVHEFDAQTSEEEAAAEIAESNAPMISDREDSPVLPSSDEPEGTGAITGAGATPDTDITGGTGSIVNTEMTDSEGGFDTTESEVLNDSEIEPNESSY